MTFNNKRPDDRRSKRIPECGACGSLDPEGGGMNVGDETFDWVCSDCRGDSALVEYGVEDTNSTDGLDKDGIEVVLRLKVAGGSFYVEEAEVIER